MKRKTDNAGHREFVICLTILISCLTLSAIADHCLTLPNDDKCVSANDAAENPDPNVFQSCWAGQDVTCPMGNSLSGNDWETTKAKDCAGPRICRDHEGVDSTMGTAQVFNTDCREGDASCPHYSAR
jgi:hypothetical protein